MELIVIVAGILLLGVVVGVVLFTSAKKARAARQEQVKELQYLLDRVAEAAAKRKTQLYQSLDGQDNQILLSLKTAAESAPVDISAELSEIDALWRDLSQQVSEFSNQSVQSTLQSSVVTSKAAQTASKINQIVKDTKQKLVA